MTPPKVLGAPKPSSSVMISRTLGAPAGGTTRGAHQGVDCGAVWLITPPNLGSGRGTRVPVMVVVAWGDPGVPVTTWAEACAARRTEAKTRGKQVAKRVAGMRTPVPWGWDESRQMEERRRRADRHQRYCMILVQGIPAG